MANSGNFTTSSSEGRSLTFSWSVKSQSVANNTTTISWSLKGSGSYSGYVICGGFEVIIDGSTVYSKSTDYRVNVYKDTTVASGTHTITHSGDGSKTFSASAEAGIYSFAVNCDGEGEWTLPTIPRASTISSAGNITLGSKCNITFTPKSTTFYYNIKFSLGTWSVNTGLFCPGTTSSYTYNGYTIPANSTLYALIPNSTTGTMTATLTTYKSNSTSAQIGTTSVKTFTVTIPSTVIPTVGTITLNPHDINNQNILIQGKNKLQISVSGCAAGSGSSIRSYTFSGPGINTTTTSAQIDSAGTIPNSGTLTYTVTVTDNRGRTASKTATITSYPWAAPTITINKAYRVKTSTSTTADDSGTYVRCEYSLTFSDVGKTNDVTVKLYYKKNSASAYTSADVLTNSTNTSGIYVLNGIDIASTYTMYATITDNYSGNTSSAKVVVSSASRILNVRSNGKGVAFGKLADTDNILDSAWTIKTDKPVETLLGLSYRGYNAISSTANDTTAKWNESGDVGNLGVTMYNTTGLLTDQPSQYGIVLNLAPNNSEVHQIWATQASGALYHRGGNRNGWSGTWRQILDDQNYTAYAQKAPVQLYSSTGAVGTVTLSQSAANFSYLEIFYTDNNGRQPNSVKISAPNNKYVTLSCIEPGTSQNTDSSGNIETRAYIRSSGWTISGTTLTPGLSGEQKGVYVGMYTTVNGYVAVHYQQYIKIVKILGYK